MRREKGARAPAAHPSFRGDMLACLLLAAACLLFFLPVLAGRVLVPAEGLYLIDPVFAPYRPPDTPDRMTLTMVADSVGQMYVWRQFTADSLRAGRIPLWNPYSACGMPFLANDQSAVLNPANLLPNLLLSPPRAQTAFALFCLFAACIFTYGLVRSLGGNPLGGILGGLTFAFGGFVLVWLGFPLAATAILLPAVLWATHRLVLKPTLPRAVLLGGLIGWQFLSGHLSTSVHILGFWAVFAVYGIVSARRPNAAGSRARVAGLLALSFLLGAGLGAPQLLPLREYVALSRVADRGRSRWAAEGIADGVAKGLLGDRWFLRNIAPGEIALLFVPERDGNPAFGDYRPHAGYGNYPERTSYVGMLALFVLLSGLLWLPPRGYRRFFLLAAWLTFGVLLHLPLLNLVTYLPLVRLAAPQRLRFVFALCAAVSLGLAAAELAPGRQRAGRRPHRLAWAAGLALAVVCAALAGAALPLLSERQAQAFPRAEALLRALKLFAPAIGAAALAALLIPSLQRRLGARSIRIGFVVLAVFDLFLFAARWHPLSRIGNVLPRVPPVRRMQELAQGSRITGPPNVFRPNLSVGYKLHDARSYDPLAVDRFVRLVEAFHGEVGTSPWLQQGSDEPIPALHRLTSVRYVWHWEPERGLEICECTSAPPRAYVTDRVRASTAGAALEALVNGPGLREPTLIEGLPVPPPPSNGFLRPASIVYDTPHRVAVRAEVERPCWLILTDTYYPGWNVTVNGRPASMAIANYAFRAVPIPRGESSLTFSYEPASYRVGLFLGLLAIAAALALLASEGLARRHR